MAFGAHGISTDGHTAAEVADIVILKRQ